MIFFILAFTLATIADRGYNSTKRIVDCFFPEKLAGGI